MSRSTTRDTLASAERVLGEGDIRDLNKILLKEPFWHTAQTPDRAADPEADRSRRVQDAAEPCHARRPGELHQFRGTRGDAGAHVWNVGPVTFGSDLHNSDAQRVSATAPSWPSRTGAFLRIHPFDDGNGRTARLLTNYVLLRSGLPPMVIKSCRPGPLHRNACRTPKLAAWRRSLGSCWRMSCGRLGLAIRAAKGESLRESEDVGKEIALFVRRNRAGEPKASDVELLDDVVSQRIRPRLKRVKKDA